MSNDSASGDAPKAGRLKKILFLSLGALLLLGGGIGAGLYFGGFLPHGAKGPVEDPHRPKLVKRNSEPTEGASDGEGGEGAEAKPAPRIGTVAVANDRVHVDPSKYEAGYLALPESFTSNLSGGDGFVQANLSLSTYYDDRVFQNVKRHMVPIRSAILMVLSTQDDAILSSPAGKARLQHQLTDAINRVLREKEGFGGIDNVYFASLVLQ